MTKPAAITVKILPNDKGNPTGKLCDAELFFNDGPLAGMKLLGFAVWERRSGNGRNVTMPSRSYSVNGERRSFSLLREQVSGQYAQDNTRTLILQAYSEYEHAANVADAEPGPQTPEERHQGAQQDASSTRKAAPATAADLAL